MHHHGQFFLKPQNPVQGQYEALRAFYVDQRTAAEAAQTFGFSESYFNKLRTLFHQRLRGNESPSFFVAHQPGPKAVESSIAEMIIALRKQNYSILDIRAALNAKGQHANLMQIDQVLKDDGFARLPRRTRLEKERVTPPDKLALPRAERFDIAAWLRAASAERRLITTRHGGLLLFYPFLQQLGIDRLVRVAGYPATEQLSALNYILSFLVLKLLDKERLSHVEQLCLDNGVGLFAGLSALPKNAALSSYSYNVTRKMNRAFLKALGRATHQLAPFGGDLNLDFTALPHWGDPAAAGLENNWKGSQHQSLKSVLAFLAQDPDSGILAYGNGEVKHRDQNDEVLTFVDFWKETHRDQPLKCLIFDARLTTYENLSRLNRDGIKFITLRRRGKNLVENASHLPADEWHTISIDHPKRKYQTPRVHDSKISLTGYKGFVRQLIITNIGREQPVFLITNDFEEKTKVLVTKYAHRWLVEKNINECIDFFHLNLLSSSIVVKVDFDLTMTILASTLYRLLARALRGFETLTAKRLFQNFVDNGAELEITKTQINIHLQKKAHNPILFEAKTFQQSWNIPWLKGIQLHFERQNTT